MGPWPSWLSLGCANAASITGSMMFFVMAPWMPLPSIFLAKARVSGTAKESGRPIRRAIMRGVSSKMPCCGRMTLGTMFGLATNVGDGLPALAKALFPPMERMGLLASRTPRETLSSIILRSFSGKLLNGLRSVGIKLAMDSNQSPGCCFAGIGGSARPLGKARKIMRLRLWFPP